MATNNINTTTGNTTRNTTMYNLRYVLDDTTAHDNTLYNNENDTHINLLYENESEYLDERNLGNFYYTNSILNLMHLNCRSLPKHFTEIRDLILVNGLDICALTETWCEDDNTQHLQIANYDFITNNRKTGRGGGVGFYLHKNYRYKIIENHSVNNQFVETLTIEIEKESTKFVIACVYRPPNTDENEFIDVMTRILSDFVTGLKHGLPLIFAGDFNLDLLKCKQHKLTHDFLSMLFSNYMTPLITLPTRITEHSQTLIDNFFVKNDDRYVYKSGVVINDISDHLPIVLSIRRSISGQHTIANETVYRTKLNHAKLNDLFQHHDWLDFCSYSETCSNANECYDKFISVITSHFNASQTTFPIRLNNKTVPKNKWMTNGLLNSRNTKNKLYKDYTINPSVENKNKYIEYRNKYNKLLTRSKHEYYNDKFEQYKSNCNMTWKTLNEILNRGTKKQDISHIEQEGQTIDDSLSIANAFNTYFANIGTSLNAKFSNQGLQSHTDFLQRAPKSANSCVFFEVEQYEVQCICNNIKTSYAEDCDGLSMNNVKPILCYLIWPLTMLFNCMLRCSTFPDRLKIAKVTPIHKAQSKSLVSNYRPISILPVFSKIFEKVLHTKISNFMNKNKLLNEQQYGFRKNHSTELALTDILDDITNAFENRQIAIGIFLDLTKAFDLISHSILLDKMYYYGFRGPCLEIIKNYLTNRNQYVDIKGQRSKLLPISIGVPQGSVLGPLLFLIFINDLPYCSQLLKFILFADDTNLFLTGRNLPALMRIANTEIKIVSQWLKNNHLLLNLSKTQYIIFNAANQPLNDLTIKIDNNPIKRVNETKFLGVTLDEKLSWSSHIDNVCLKLSRIMGVIARVKYCIPRRSLFQLYYSLVYPHMLYSCIIWGSADLQYTNKIQIIQNKILRILTNSNIYTNINHMFYQANILKFGDIYKLQLLLFFHKVKLKLLPEKFNNYICLNSSSFDLRNNILHLYARSQIRKRHPKIIAPTYYTKIPANLKLKTNIKAYKKLIIQFTIQQYDITHSTCTN